jgi:SAM-dependent methyltransferase
LDDRSESQIPDDFHARWKSRFEEFANLRDDDAGIAGWTTSGLQTRFRNFRRLWKCDRRDTLWLDIGCGAGTYTRFLNDEGLRVIGIDYSLPALIKARARSTPDIEWVAGDVTRLPVQAGSLDGALCFGVLQAIPDSRLALRSIAQALKTSGKLWIDVLNARCLPNRIEVLRRRKAGKPMHLRYETAEAFRKALSGCGFDVIALHWIPILPARLVRLQPLAESRAARLLFRFFPLLSAWVSHSILVEARRI